MWEAKYNGARVVTTTPDYNPTSIHADRWLNVHAGADPFLYMSMVHTILSEELVDWGFIKEQIQTSKASGVQVGHMRPLAC